MNYDDCVRLAAEQAELKEHGVIIQDTAWEGYEEIPCRIMQGYGTMAKEAAEQMKEYAAPTHVFVQAGVGSLAAAVVGYFTNLYKKMSPKYIVMEAAAAACLYKGVLDGTGEPAVVKGELDTIMAGLACGEPNPIGWDILRNHADAFISCQDSVSELGMRMLAAPLRGDPRIVSGESGAVGMGVLYSLMKKAEYRALDWEATAGCSCFRQRAIRIPKITEGRYGDVKV